MMTAMIQSARGCGLKRMYVQVLATNTRMLKFAQRHGFVATSGTDHAAIKTLSLPLDETSRGRVVGNVDNCTRTEPHA